jgi:tRNA A-37 threonylcarbamoyl transferase component Bud32
MSALPRTIRIQPADTTLPIQEVVCRRMLRLLAGRRETFDASWQDRPVILKVFAHPWKAWLHARRERRGFERLAQRGIAAPVVLLSGCTDDGRWAVVTEKIEGARSLSDIRATRGGCEPQAALLVLAGAELARLHENGVLQTDFHPGNFLVCRDRLLVLDPGQIRFLSRPVGRAVSIRQLADLVCILVPDDHPGAMERLQAAYAEVRRWDWGAPEQTLLQEAMRAGRREGMRRAARRPLQKGRDHVRIRIPRGLAVARRAFAESGDFAGLVAGIDRLLESGRPVAGRAAHITGRFPWERRQIVARRFDEKGLLRRIVGILRGTPARRLWDAARRLGALSIATARPLALIERRDDGLLCRSYLLTEPIDGRPLCEFLSDGEVSTQRKHDILWQAFAVLDRLARYGVTLGRLEPADVLVRDDRPVFAARADMVVHVLHARCRRRYRDQRQRLICRLSELGFGSLTVGVNDGRETPRRVPV